MARMTDRIRCAWDNNDFYCAKINVIVSKQHNQELLKSILGILNSNLTNYYYKEIYRALHKKGDALGFDIPSIEKLPFPDLEKDNNICIVVNKILEITNSEDYVGNKEKQDAVIEYEKQIDIMVYKLYDLTYQEVLIIDKDFSISEEEYNIYKYRNMQ